MVGHGSFATIFTNLGRLGRCILRLSEMQQPSNITKSVIFLANLAIVVKTDVSETPP